MTLKELKKIVKVKSFGILQNLIDVTITYRGKRYTCESRNKNAYRAIENNTKPNSAEARVFRYSEKTAYEAFYKECKRKNKLR